MQRKKMETKKASFFKVMIGNFAEKMHIPMQFLLDFSRELCRIHVAILNGPHGTGWRVRLKVEDGRMFFGCGWREFIKHHDIQEGYFLIFTYDRQSHFDVEVFDKSCCLKKYACVDNPEDLCQTKEIRKNYPGLRRSVRHSQTSNPIKRKISKSENKVKNAYKEKLRSYEKNKGTKSLSGLENSIFEVSDSEDNQETPPGKRLKAEKEVVERESSHPNPKHYHFKAVINRSNVMKPYMCIPKEFTLTNDLTIGRTMTLRDPEQRLWTVTIDRQRNSCSTYFSSGWTKFAVANGMKVGDVCFFDIVPTMKDVMDVRIGRRATKVKNALFGF